MRAYIFPAFSVQVAFWASPQDRDQVKTFADLTLRGDNSWREGEKLFLASKVQDMRQVGKI